MKAKHERVLHQYGDRCLFYAESEDRTWSLPLFVEWRLDKENDLHFAHVIPAVCLYQSQAIALVALLQVHDIMGRKDQWVIPRRICEAILHKAPGITPAFYYRWEDSPPIEAKPPLRTAMQQRGPATHEKNRGNDPIRRSFVEWLAKDTKISSSIINAVLNAVATGAPTWMVEHRKPLDLGFCRIVALPFRANWKEIVAFKAKCRGIKLRSLFALPGDEVADALEDCGLPAMMASPHNVGLRRGFKSEVDVARIDYTIEAIATDAFEAAANQIESKRMARGPAAYVAEFEDAVEAVYDHAVQALRAYLKKVSIPFATVGKSGGSGRIRFEPVVGRKITVRGTPLGNLPVRIVGADTRFSVFGTQSDPSLLPAPPTPVQEMPDLSQGTDDVRERTVDGHLQLLDGGSPDGLPMRPQSKIEDGGG